MLGFMTRFAAFLMVPLLAQAQAAKPQYEVFAVHYATMKDFPVSGLVRGADPTRKMDVCAMFWVIKGEGRTILFDAGFYRDQFMKQWHPSDYQKPSEAVARLGLKPSDITDVIISHIHWDHADGFDLFPNATIWIQKDELEYYAGEAWQGHKRTAADPDVILGLVRLNTLGRVHLVHGDDQTIFPGITAYIGGKHTWQSQFITVATAAGTVVLASDNAYLYENLDKRIAIAQTLDVESNLRAQDRMHQLASNPRLIVPGHDPLVMTRFPEVAPGVVRIQ
jgi:glyoxylase-like metal-dependent hydrolase (beta-lactamase superfamily II)